MEANTRRHPSFFVWMALAIALVVFIGFAPSYYLKSFSDFRDLRTLEHIHGVIATLWITLLITQTLLIRTHRVANHRLLGYFGAVLAIAMAVSISLLIFVSAKARISAGLQDIEVFALHVRFFWGDTVMLISFSTFAAMGITLRRKRDIHRRLMLLATLSLVSPTIGRIADFSIWGGLPSPIIVLPIFVSLLAALIIYDIRTRGRPHLASIIGAPTIFILAAGAAFVLPQFELAQKIATML